MIELYHGDNLDVFPLLEDESVDTVITDSPYGLKFMGKYWDHSVPGVRYWAECLRVSKPGAMLCAFGGTRTHHRLMCAIEDAGWEIRDVLMWVFGSGFPKGHDCAKAIQGKGRQEFLTGARHSIRTGASYQCGCSDNCRQCGVSLHAETGNGQGAVPLLADAQERSHLFETLPQTLAGISHRCTAFCGGLSFHLSKQDYRSRKVADAWLLLLEAASCLCLPCFEQLVRGASDDAKHQDGTDWSNIDALSVVSDWETSEILYRILDMSPLPYSHYNTEAEHWQGWNCALKPAYEPIILAMKPLPGTFAQNALGYGVAGLWVDGCRVASNGHKRDPRKANGTKGGSTFHGQEYDDRQQAYSPTTGRWPANLLLSHAPGCERVGVRGANGTPKVRHNSASIGYQGSKVEFETVGYEGETVEAWNCVPECPVRLLDEQSGERPTPGTYTRATAGEDAFGSGIYSSGKWRPEIQKGYADTGGASRFFTRFAPSADLWYTSKDTIQYAIGRCLQCGNESDRVTLFCVGENQEAEPSTASQSTPISGSKLTGQFLTGSLSTTETETEKTTDLKTCNLSAENIIHGIIQITSERPRMDGSAIARCATCGSLWMVSTNEARQDSNDTVRNAAASNSGNGNEQTGTRCKDTSNDTSATESECAQTRFRYSSKASRAERELGLLGHIPCLKCGLLDSVTHLNPKTGKEEKCRRNGHPTVKPLDVCRWLCRLTRTPTGGVVLDPFMGSGRISMAAILEGRDTIGIELERPSFEIAQAGVRWAQEQVPDMIQAEFTT